MVREGDNRLGPNLYKIVGRKAGSLPDYAFSNAMKEAGFVWDEEKLDRFIANPDEVVPGNNMKPYGGLSSSDDRKKSSPSLLNSDNRGQPFQPYPAFVADCLRYSSRPPSSAVRYGFCLGRRVTRQYP